MPTCEGQKGLGNTKEPILVALLFSVLSTVGWRWDTKVKIRRELYFHQREDSRGIGGAGERAE